MTTRFNIIQIESEDDFRTQQRVRRITEAQRIQAENRRFTAQQLQDAQAFLNEQKASQSKELFQAQVHGIREWIAQQKNQPR